MKTVGKLDSLYINPLWDLGLLGVERCHMQHGAQPRCIPLLQLTAALNKLQR